MCAPVFVKGANMEFINSFKIYQKFKNPFLRLNPIVRLNTMFAIALSGMIVGDYRYGFSICLFLVVFNFIVGSGVKFIKIFAYITFLLLGFLFFIRQIGSPGPTVIAEVLGFKITLEPLMNTLNISSGLILFSASLLTFFLNTQMRDLMYSLVKLGMSHTVSYMVLASFQTVIDLRKTMVTIMDSQKARGIETDGNVFVRSKAFFPVLAPVVFSAFSSAEEKTIAMEARAFAANTAHTHLRRLRPTPKYEIALAVVANLYLVGVIVFKLFL